MSGSLVPLLPQIYVPSRMLRLDPSIEAMLPQSHADWRQRYLASAIARKGTDDADDEDPEDGGQPLDSDIELEEDHERDDDSDAPPPSLLRDNVSECTRSIADVSAITGLTSLPPSASQIGSVVEIGGVAATSSFDNTPLPNLSDITTAQFTVRLQDQLECCTIIVIRDRLGVESYWYPAVEFCRQSGRSTHDLSTIVDPINTRSYDELRCEYGLRFDFHLQTLYMNDHGMNQLLYRKFTPKCAEMRLLQADLLERVTEFRRARFFVLLELVRSLVLQQHQRLTSVAVKPNQATTTESVVSSVVSQADQLI